MFKSLLILSVGWPLVGIGLGICAVGRGMLYAGERVDWAGTQVWSKGMDVVESKLSSGQKDNLRLQVALNKAA
jgi:hypothetical protein